MMVNLCVLCVCVQERAKRKRVAAADEILFPDEVDTPTDIPAQERFARYRGLKSFRTSPWDPKENLPFAYSHIFEIPHYIHYQRQVMQEAALAEKALDSIQALRADSMKSEKRDKRASFKLKQYAARNAASVIKGGLPLGEDGGEDDDAMHGTGGASGGGGGESVVSGKTGTGGGGGADMSLSDVLGPGWTASSQFVCIQLRNVPRSALYDCAVPGVPLTAFSLLRFENRASVMHYNLMRTDSYVEPLKSKEDLEFYVGGRCFDAKPLFSEADQKSDRNKLDRYFQHGRWTMASVYGPICYSPGPTLVFKRIPINAEGEDVVTADDTLAPLYPAPDRVAQALACSRFRLELVATGSVWGSDPNRLIIKKVLLSGYPVKVKRRHALVKLMFFNAPDIEYFKPLDVWTKHGLVGM